MQQTGLRFIQENLHTNKEALTIKIHSRAVKIFDQRKSAFELLQNELEEMTERLSEMIARPYLRTPRRVIIQTIQLTRKKRQEFLRAAYRGFVSFDRKLDQSSNMSTATVSTNSHASIDRKRLIESMTEDGYTRKAVALKTENKPAFNQIRLRQCCRKGCSNLCLSTTPSNTRLKEFCSPLCSMKFGRRNTVEKFDPLPQVSELAGKGKASESKVIDRYHTLPHHIGTRTSLKKETEKKTLKSNEVAMTTSELPADNPPEVPPHQQLLSSKNPPSNNYLSVAQKQARFSSKSVSTDGAEGRCLEETTKAVEPVVNMSSANETVTSFLRSIALREEDELSLNSSFDNPQGVTLSFEPPQTSSVIRRTGEVADGKFRISDIHESGVYSRKNDPDALLLLKRSQSTGDIDTEALTNELPYLDSDHSCCQGDPPEYRQVERSKFDPDEESDTNSVPKLVSVMIKANPSERMKSSKSETSLSRKLKSQLGDGNLTHRRAIFMRQKSFDVDSDSTDIDASLTPSSEQNQRQASVDELPPGLVQEVHKKDSVKFPNANYTTGKKKPDLTINIFNSSFENQTNRQDTIIEDFKSPTLHISGIAISRSPPGATRQTSGTPLKKYSPVLKATSPQQAVTNLTVPYNSNRNRSSSLVVPQVKPQSGPRRSSNSPGRMHSAVNLAQGTILLAKGSRCFPTSPVSKKSSNGETFTFPVITSNHPTLSSVLHVHDSNLSSDDFHEAMFFDRSPKSAKKRRKFKKVPQATPPKNVQKEFLASPVNTSTSPSSGNTLKSGKKLIKVPVSPSQQPSHIFAH